MDIRLRNAKSKNKQYNFRDQAGLYLLAQPNDTYWMLKYYFTGQWKLLSRGVFQ